MIRKHPLVSNEVYHVFNRSIAQQPIFRNVRENNLFLELIEYYRFKDTKLRFSYYSRLPENDKREKLDSLYKNNNRLVEIYALAFMPNHYHILAKQSSENGISEFIRYLQDSYAKYLNKKINRSGGLFQSPFKAVRIENDEQLLHVARYIHLNPLTSYLLRAQNDLFNYPWNSFIDYMSSNPRRFINIQQIRSFFKTQDSLKKFTFNHSDYQKKLEGIKHLILE